MRIGPELGGFLESPVMIILGTRDAANRPAIGRGVGARVVGEEDVAIVVSARQWPGTVADLRGNGRLAATFARPSDYVTWQLKGRATLRAAEEADRALSAGYLAAIARVLVGLGSPDWFPATLFDDGDPVVSVLSVDAAYEQTPGPRAGRPRGDGA